MSRAIVVSCLFVSFAVNAATKKELIATALERVAEAQDEAHDAAASCKKKLLGPLDDLDDAVRAAKKSEASADLKSAGRAADRAADLAETACTGSAGKRLSKALSAASTALDEARDVKDDAPPPVLGAIAQGLGGLFAGAAREETTSSSKTTKRTRTEQVNGQDLDEPDERDPFGDRKRDEAKKKDKDGPSRGEFGATCSNNSECNSNTCYRGTGSLGYCTKMCSEDDDCPRKMFEWRCYRPQALNAPQKLCLQSN